MEKRSGIASVLFYIRFVSSFVMPLRSLVVAALILAWLAASNHCAFSSIVAHKVTSAGHDGMPPDCPMHAQHHSSPQEKQNDCAQLPCCKNLQATSTPAARLAANPFWTGALVAFFTSAKDKVCAARLTRALFNDTGPPGECSFAELVLQRSVRAHAPPVSLS